MIHSDSRYLNNPVSVVTSDRGTHQSMTNPFPEDKQYSFSYYTVEEGVTTDWLGFFETGEGCLWWMIADANPEILDWHDLKPGTVIRVPVV